MSKVLIESQYIPTIGFFSLLYNSEALIIDKHENYHKGSFRNRCEILSSQGRSSLSVPLRSGKNNQQAILNVAINNEEKWGIKHLRSIEACYGKSPYFEYYFHYCRSILERKHSHLFDLNMEFINCFAEILDLKEKLEESTTFIDSSNEILDLKRDFISPKTKDQERIKAFFEFTPYDQVFSEERAFEANLSILDLIFCQGPEAVLYLAKSIKK